MTALCGKEFEHRASGTARKEVGCTGMTLDFGMQHPEQLTRLALLKILDDLLELVEEHDQRPPATRPLDCVHGANHGRSLWLSPSPHRQNSMQAQIHFADERECLFQGFRQVLGERPMRFERRREPQ
jgi:hypothetical protein